MGTPEEIEKIKAAIEKFPPFFGLRAFPGKRCKINEYQSFFSQGRILLYVYIETGADQWEALSKGTPVELQREVIPL